MLDYRSVNHPTIYPAILENFMGNRRPVFGHSAFANQRILEGDSAPDFCVSALGGFSGGEHLKTNRFFTVCLFILGTVSPIFWGTKMVVGVFFWYVFWYVKKNISQKERSVILDGHTPPRMPLQNRRFNHDRAWWPL